MWSVKEKFINENIFMWHKKKNIECEVCVKVFEYLEIRALHIEVEDVKCCVCKVV